MMNISDSEKNEDIIVKWTGTKRAMFAHMSKSKEYIQATSFMEVNLGRY